MRKVFALALLAALSGCSAVTTGLDEVAMNKVPPKVVAGLSRKYSDLKINAVEKQTFADGHSVYLFDSVTDSGAGDQRLVRVASTGKVLN